VWIAERIEQGIRSGRIAKPIEKKGFVGKKKENEVNNLKGGYKGKGKNTKTSKHLPPKSLVSTFPTLYPKPTQSNKIPSK
jgi:hypothetical protein